MLLLLLYLLWVAEYQMPEEGLCCPAAGALEPCGQHRTQKIAGNKQDTQASSNQTAWTHTCGQNMWLTAGTHKRPRNWPSTAAIGNSLARAALLPGSYSNNTQQRQHIPVVGWCSVHTAHLVSHWLTGCSRGHWTTCLSHVDVLQRRHQDMIPTNLEKA